MDASSSIEQALKHINMPFHCSQAQGRLAGLNHANVTTRVSANDPMQEIVRHAPCSRSERPRLS
jgi:hypothetical protein